MAQDSEMLNLKPFFDLIAEIQNLRSNLVEFFVDRVFIYRICCTPYDNTDNADKNSKHEKLCPYYCAVHFYAENK